MFNNYVDLDVHVHTLDLIEVEIPFVTPVILKLNLACSSKVHLDGGTNI